MNESVKMEAVGFLRRLREDAMSRLGANICLLLALHCFSCAHREPRERALASVARYELIIGDRLAGSQVTEISEDGERRISYEYNDRGRGPRLTVKVRLGSDGTPVLIETSGYNYWKTKVEERFSLQGQKAIWKSSLDSAEKTISRPAFYIPATGTPEQWALLARALLAAPDRKLDLLPQGLARIEKGDEIEVRAGGQARRVIRYEIDGLGLEPTSIWLDQQGRFFAEVDAWSSIVLEGWKDVSAVLLASQERWRAARSEKMASSLGQRLARSWVIRGGNVFDAERGTMHPDYAVVGSGDRINAVGPAAQLQVPSGAEVIDASGKSVLPGLWDMHAHFFESQGPLYIASGVTTVRDMANDIDILGDLRRRIEAGKAIGPRVITAGFLDGSGPYAGPTKVLVDNEEQARAAIDRYAQLNYEQTKIYSSIKPELVPFIVGHSHQRGLRVSGHVPAGMNAEEAVRIGFDELQHVNFIFLNFLVEKSADTRTPLRFTAVVEHAAELDLDSPRVQSFIALLKQKNVVVDPTVSAFENMFLAKTGEISPTYASIASRLPLLTGRQFLLGGLAVAPGMEARRSSAFQALLKMVERLHSAGVPIVAGTDSALPGFVLHRELELYVQAGLPPSTVLRIGTFGAATVMKHDRESGSVAPGKHADLIIVDGNPSEHISDIRKIRKVLKGGMIFDAEQLQRAIGLSPAFPPRSGP